MEILAFIWNMRGFGSKDRRRQLRDFLRKEPINIIGLQETIRRDFDVGELESLTGTRIFEWHWLASRGHSGGILLRVDSEQFEVLCKESGSFYVSLTLKQVKNGKVWECIVVYGPADHTFSEDFLRDLDAKLCRTAIPVMIVGDFNLIHSARDKNNDRLDFNLMGFFNDFIAHHQLRELQGVGGGEVFMV